MIRACAAPSSITPRPLSAEVSALWPTIPLPGPSFPPETPPSPAKGTRMDGSTTTNSFKVTVNAPTTTTVASVAGQYSDQVALKANVTNTVCPSGSVEFKVNDSVVGSAPVTGGMATLPYTIPLAQGSYPIVATH